MLAERLLGGDRGGVVDEGLVQGDALGGERGREGGPGQQDDQGRRPHAARRPVDEARDAPPHPFTGARGGRSATRPGGPVGGAAEHDEDGRQERERGEDGAADADGADRPERPVVGEVAEQQGEQAQRDGRGAGHDRAPGLPQRGPHGLETVGARAEFLPEAGGEEEGVVGGGADDEDGQDALDLSVHADDSVVGERVHDRAGEAEGEHRAEDDHQREQDAAVDEQQDHQHGEERDGEQQTVDAGEGVGEVRLTRGGARHPDGGAGNAFGGGADPVQGAGQIVVEAGPQRDHSSEGFAVLGEQCGRDPPRHAGSAVEGGEGTVGRGAPLGKARARPHDDRQERLVLPEGPLGGYDLGGFGAARQERGLVVGGDLTEASGVGAQDSSDDEPDGDQREGNEPARAPGVVDMVLQAPDGCISTKNNLND